MVQLVEVAKKRQQRGDSGSWCEKFGVGKLTTH